jgi:tRNA A37 threonylcarbamoyladenosine dehydratase
MSEQFLGTIKIYGEEKFKLIEKSKVLIVGVGGVGSWAAESLARTGVSEITIVDMDDICISNINRQVHSTHLNIGQEKVKAMKERLTTINKNIKVNTVFDFLTASTIDEILEPGFDFVLDSMDSVDNKCLLITRCMNQEIPFITVGAAGNRFDATKIEIRDLNRTINDKMAKRIKRTLKREYGFNRRHENPYRIPCVTSTEEINEAVLGPKPDTTRVHNCQTTMGSISHVTATMGLIAAGYIVNKLAGVECS